MRSYCEKARVSNTCNSSSHLKLNCGPWTAQLDGVNSIYICFAFDRDRKVVTHPEIHHVYECVPTLSGALIQQPDGGVAYGAQQHDSAAPVYAQQQPAPGGHLYAPAQVQMYGVPAGAPPSYGAAGQPMYGAYPQPAYPQPGATGPVVYR